jgi:putative tryptophan/tyrosine transport system ATP-binding protein
MTTARAATPAVPPRAGAPPALALRGAVKTFHPGSVNATPALRDVDLTVQPGEFVTVIGGNGAGKSTLLNAIAGVFALDAGSVRVAGRDCTALSEDRRAAWIGRVFQDPLAGTAPNLTLEQNLAMALLRGGRRGLGRGVTEDRRRRFREELARLGLGLENRLQTRAGLLSGGQRQAVTLLMATLQRPALLLLDEHTAALDPATAETIAHLTGLLTAESHLAVLMVTHHMGLALAMGTRTLMLHQGQIILDLSGAERQAQTVRSLVEKFFALRGTDAASDRMLLY